MIRASAGVAMVAARFVPGSTAGPENVAAIARFSAGFGNGHRVDVLPSHQMGRFKWKELGHGGLAGPAAPTVRTTARVPP